MTDDLTELIQQEELKRLRMTDPARWWQQMQELCTLAEAQTVPRRNSKAGCLQAQAILLEQLAKYQSRVESNANIALDRLAD
jgi:hypothetical protein